MKFQFLLALSAALSAPVAQAADEVTRVEVRSLDVRRAADIVMTYQVVCQDHAYTFTAPMSPVNRRALSLFVLIRAGDSRNVDLSDTELGRLMRDPAGTGELGFGCGDGVYVRYQGARLPKPGGPLEPVTALFRLGKDGGFSTERQ